MPILQVPPLMLASLLLSCICEQGLAINTNSEVQQALNLATWSLLLSWAIGPSVIDFPLTSATKNTSL